MYGALTSNGRMMPDMESDFDEFQALIDERSRNLVKQNKKKKLAVNR